MILVYRAIILVAGTRLCYNIIERCLFFSVLDTEYPRTHTHTHTHIYIYMCTCVYTVGGSRGGDREGLPLVKSLLTGIVLQTTVVNQEFHSLEERGRDSGRLLPQQDVDGLGCGDAELAAATDAVGAALGIGAVDEPVYKDPSGCVRVR
jgi:hypothetical protein